MRKLTYLAILEPSEDGYGVYFPDVAGCISFGDNIENAQNNAKEALELHIYEMEKMSEELPNQSKNLKEIPENCIVTPVTIFPDIVKYEMDRRRIKTNITIPAWLKALAEEKKVNLSRLLEISLIEYLQTKDM